MKPAKLYLVHPADDGNAMLAYLKTRRIYEPCEVMLPDDIISAEQRATSIDRAWGLIIVALSSIVSIAIITVCARYFAGYAVGALF